MTPKDNDSTAENNWPAYSPGAARMKGGARSDKRATESSVDRILFALELSSKASGARVALPMFSPALLMTPDIAERSRSMAGDGTDILYDMTDEAIPGWRVSVAVENSEGSPQLMRAEHIQQGSAAMLPIARRARRLGFRRPDQGYRLSLGTVDHGVFNSGSMSLANVGGRLVKIPHARARCQSTDVDDISASRLPMLSGIALTDRYQWSVSFNLGASISLRVWCSMESARRIFNDRDKPAGTGRRTALRDWVCEHWRAMPNDPDEETQVISHMRGTQSFAWRGYSCTVMPSQFAMERAGIIRESKRKTGPVRRRRRGRA